MVARYVPVFNCPKSLFVFMDNPEMPRGHFLLSNISQRPVNTLVNPFKEPNKPHTARPEAPSKQSRPWQHDPAPVSKQDDRPQRDQRDQREPDETGRDLVKWSNQEKEVPRRSVGVRDEEKDHPTKPVTQLEVKNFIQIPSNLSPEEQLQFLLKMQQHNVHPKPEPI
jgi:hypothetical protein